ncbi:hypothetical protein KOM00_04900 [Geomonas sp. Red69]|uniref:acyltransferase n=1 Tax=Geomonas diazotrophica TaxID=2843197 RepID=UPI001C0FFC4F|nr:MULTISPECIES: DapH/DapD/GlmU-related protein [Geomonas]MBU5636064.1 hypothetical protein [Geomonas diazotrophica]QXE85033.1 hypothetical protein KP003_11550 [Geomonas nitrogeniifigens]
MLILCKNIFNLVAKKLYYAVGWVKASMYGVELSSAARISPYADVKEAAFLGDVVIGRDVSIGCGTYVNSGDISAATIGRYCSIAYNVLIGPTEHIPDHWTTSPFEAVVAGFTAASTTKISPRPVIEDNVWVGANVVVLRGVTIHRGAIIAAGAVVTRDVPSNQIWGGVPAKFLRDRDVPPRPCTAETPVPARKE